MEVGSFAGLAGRWGNLFNDTSKLDTFGQLSLVKVVVADKLCIRFRDERRVYRYDTIA